MNSLATHLYGYVSGGVRFAACGIMLFCRSHTTAKDEVTCTNCKRVMSALTPEERRQRQKEYDKSRYSRNKGGPPRKRPPLEPTVRLTVAQAQCLAAILDGLPHDDAVVAELEFSLCRQLALIEQRKRLDAPSRYPDTDVDRGLESLPERATG